jgi:hypothetical protein
VRRYLLGFAVLGLVGCFLPLIGGTSISLLDLHHLRGHGALRSWLLVAAFAAPLVAAWRCRPATAGLVAVVSFGYLALRVGPRCLDLVLYAGIGGKLIGVAVVGGVIATVGALLEAARPPRVSGR